MKYQFPDNFKWGSAVWAQGTEGAFDQDGKAPTVWDEYYRLAPNRFFNQVGPSETLDFYHEYKKYAALAKDLGHNSYRTSILWARLIPDGKNINEKAVVFYRDMFKSFKNQGIELSVVLYWFDMPLLYENKGGFTTREIFDDFVFYCRTCFDLFDGLVDNWYIYNEPICDVVFKYQDDMCYPNKMDITLALKAIYNMCIAHALVVDEFHKGHWSGKIGSVLNRSEIYARSQHPADLKAKHMDELISYDCYEYPLLKGCFSEEWLEFAKKYCPDLEIREGDAEIIARGKIELVGLNIYSPFRVKAKETLVNPEAPVSIGFMDSPFFDSYVMHGRQFNKDRGWEIYPKVMYDVLMKFKNEYGNPEMYITENGIGIQDEYRYRDHSGQIQDDYRIDFVKQHLKFAYQAIQEGARLSGYNMWSFVDLWSPTNQFKNCYGFYEFDLKTKETKKKKSADWFKEITKDNGFED